MLNPTAVAHAGTTYLLYRAVALTSTTYSRILLATCRLVASRHNRWGILRWNWQRPTKSGPTGRGAGSKTRVTLLDGHCYMVYTAYGMVDGRTAPVLPWHANANLFH